MDILKYENYNKDFIKYSDKENEYYSFLLERIETARNLRGMKYTELNDMNYDLYYDTNLKAANSYIAPKKNKNDTRVVTGTTEEKELSLISAILNYNLQPSLFPYDTVGMEIPELGSVVEQLVMKSRELEMYDDKKPLIYKELFDQGTCYVEEQWVEESKIAKKMKKGATNMSKMSDIEWTEEQITMPGECRVRLIEGKKVYLGNIREFSERNQPFIFIADQISYAEAETIYGDWERWQFVQKDVVKFCQTNDSTYRVWTLSEMQKDMVEVIKYYDKFANEVMIILNGIMMLPVGFPLTEVSPSGEIPVVKADAYPISQFFAISKSIPSKTKVDQETVDEMLKLIVLKTRKSFQPPLANNTGRVLSDDIQIPGTITNQIDPDKIKPIGDTTGVSLSEFNAFQFIRNIIDEKSVSPTFTGDISKGDKTATEILEVKKQGMMKLGMVLWGVLSLERKLTDLRIANILANWTKDIDEQVDPITKKLEKLYRTVVVEGSVGDGAIGKSIVEFSENVNEYSPAMVAEEEKMLGQTYKMPVKKTYISPSISALKMNWKIVINPVERESNEFDRILFKQDIQDAITLFGSQSLNYGYLRNRYATFMKENPDKFFLKNVQSFPAQEAMKGGDQGGLGAQLNRGMGTAAIPGMI